MKVTGRTRPCDTHLRYTEMIPLSPNELAVVGSLLLISGLCGLVGSLGRDRNRDPDERAGPVWGLVYSRLPAISALSLMAGVIMLWLS